MEWLKNLGKTALGFFTDDGTGINKLDWSNIALLGGLGALLSNDKVKDFIGLGGGSQQPVGYQGGIPKYTATRTALPMVDTNLQNAQIRDWATQYGMNPDIQLAEAQKAMGQGTSFDQLMGYAAQRGKPYTPKEAMPSRRPGSGGRRYFSDVTYTPAGKTPAGGTVQNSASPNALTNSGVSGAGVSGAGVSGTGVSGTGATQTNNIDPLLAAYRNQFLASNEGQYGGAEQREAVKALAAANPNLSPVDFLLNFGVSPNELYTSGALPSTYYSTGTYDVAPVYREAYNKNPAATYFDTSLGRNVNMFTEAPLGGLNTWDPREDRYSLIQAPTLSSIRDKYDMSKAIRAAVGGEPEAGYLSTDFQKAADELGIDISQIMAAANARPEYVVISDEENIMRPFTGDPTSFKPLNEKEKGLGRKYMGNNKVEYFSLDSPVFNQNKGVVTAAQGGLMSLPQSRGYYLGGPTDGMADRVPARIDGRQEARLSDGEFVIDAGTVSALGNGNSQAGAQVLYDMMERVRQAAHGKKEQQNQINPRKVLPA